MKEKKSTHIRKGEIVQAAFEVLGRDGAKALTITAIAKTAGMSEANIYRHFKGKEAIYSSLVDFIGSEVMGKAATIAAGSRRPREKLETIFFSHMALIEEHPGMPRMIFSEDIRLGDRKLGEKISLRLRGYVETLAGIIAAGIDEGDFRRAVAQGDGPDLSRPHPIDGASVDHRKRVFRHENRSEKTVEQFHAACMLIFFAFDVNIYSHNLP